MANHAETHKSYDKKESFAWINKGVLNQTGVTDFDLHDSSTFHEGSTNLFPFTTLSPEFPLVLEQLLVFNTGEGPYPIFLSLISTGKILLECQYYPTNISHPTIHKMLHNFSQFVC